MTYVVKFINPKLILPIKYETRVWLYLD